MTDHNPATLAAFSDAQLLNLAAYFDRKADELAKRNPDAQAVASFRAKAAEYRAEVDRRTRAA